MPLIHVRALPGRVAFTAPRGGKRIPDDKFITVPLNPWIANLIQKHGDVEFRQPDEHGGMSLRTKSPAPPAPLPPLDVDPSPETTPRRKSERQRAGTDK